MRLIDLMARYQLYNKEHKYWESLLSIRACHSANYSTYTGAMNMLVVLGVGDKDWYM